MIPGGTGALGLMFAGYVPLASRSPYPIIVYFLANYRPHLSYFLENVIFAIPTYSLFYLCIYLINPLKKSSKNELTQFLKVNTEHFTFTYNTSILVRLLTVNIYKRTVINSWKWKHSSLNGNVIIEFWIWVKAIWMSHSKQTSLRLVCFECDIQAKEIKRSLMQNKFHVVLSSMDDNNPVEE